MENVTQELVDDFLSRLVANAIAQLEDSNCVYLDDDGTIDAQTPGRVASYYYLSHLTMRLFTDQLSDEMGQQDLLHLLSDAQEYAELPVRHNEDGLNEELAK